MNNDVRAVFVVLGILAALLAALAGWLMIINLAPTFAMGALWSAVYFSVLCLLLFALAGEGNPMAGYRWMVRPNDRC